MKACVKTSDVYKALSSLDGFILHKTNNIQYLKQFKAAAIGYWTFFEK